MNDKWDKLKNFVSYRLTELTDKGSPIHSQDMIGAYEEVGNMMNLLEYKEKDTMQEKLWIEVPFDEALQTWADGYDIRCMIDNEYLKYENPKLVYDTLRDECGSPPCAMEILRGVWSYRKED